MARMYTVYVKQNNKNTLQPLEIRTTFQEYN